MYLNEKSSVKKNNQLFSLKKIAQAILITSALAIVSPVIAQDAVTATSSQNIQSPLNNVELISMLKQNKEEVLKNGQQLLKVKSSFFNFHKEDVDQNAHTVINTLEKAGFLCYVVGGAVRDVLLGKQIHDVDLVTDATPDEIVKLFDNSKIWGQKGRFILARVYVGDDIFELATFRHIPDVIPNDDKLKADKDGTLILDNNYTRSAQEDAKCRDLTINSVFFDLNNEEFIDYNAGLYDLLLGHVIECPRSAELTFTQQPGRALRAIRFAAKLGFDISDDTAEGLMKTKQLLLTLERNFLCREVTKYFNGGYSAKSYELLKKYGLFDVLFPTVANNVAEKNNDNFIKNALLASDDRYVANDHDDPSFAFATILYPRYLAELSKINKQNLSRAQSIASKVLEEQDKITIFPKDMKERITALWLMQTELLKIDSKQTMDDVIADEAFIDGFKMLKARALADKTLQPYVDIYEPYYKAKVNNKK